MDISKLPDDVLAVVLQIQVDQMRGARAMKIRQSVLRSVCQRFKAILDREAATELMVVSSEHLEALQTAINDSEAFRRVTSLFVEVTHKVGSKGEKRDLKRVANILIKCPHISTLSCITSNPLSPGYPSTAQMKTFDRIGIGSAAQHAPVTNVLLARTWMRFIELPGLRPKMALVKEMFEKNWRLRSFVTSGSWIEKVGDPYDFSWRCRGREKAYVKAFGSKDLTAIDLGADELDISQLAQACPRLQSLRLSYDTSGLQTAVINLSTGLAALVNLSSISVQIGETDADGLALGLVVSALLESTATTMRLSAPPFVWSDLPVRRFIARLAASVAREERSLCLAMPDRTQLFTSFDREAVWSRLDRQRAIDSCLGYNITLSF